MAEDRIVLTGLVVRGFHGVYPEEAEDGQDFVIDLELDVDLATAARSDEVTDTVDYAKLTEQVAACVSQERWNLIERVAGRICELVLEHPLVLAVSVTVHKPDAPMPFEFEDVAVTVSRSR